jgi:hypothetical protein
MNFIKRRENGEVAANVGQVEQPIKEKKTARKRRNIHVVRGNSILCKTIESNRCIGVLGVLSRLRGLGVIG